MIIISVIDFYHPGWYAGGGVMHNVPRVIKRMVVWDSRI